MQDRCAFQNAGSQGVVERGERQGFDQRMDDGGESFVREEDSREDPHRHHHQVDQAADGFDLLQGTLDMLILKAVSLSPLHGYGILLRIQQISKERLEIQQGSLYPALYRLQHQGWIASEWGESENKRRARYYRLTAAGKRRLQLEAKRWNEMTAVIAGILQTTPEEL